METTWTPQLRREAYVPLTRPAWSLYELGMTGAVGLGPERQSVLAVRRLQRALEWTIRAEWRGAVVGVSLAAGPQCWVPADDQAAAARCIVGRCHERG